MPSHDHCLLYSTDLLQCATDSEMHRLIAEHDLAKAAHTNDNDHQDDFSDLGLVPVEETDDEILSGIDDFVVEGNEKAALVGDLIAPKIEVCDKVISTIIAPRVRSKTRCHKVTRTKRGNDSKDRQTLATIQKTFVARPYPKDPLLVDIWFNPLPTYYKADNDNVDLPIWKHSADTLKLTFANRGLVHLGRSGGFSNDVAAWTLNLSPERIADAQRHPKGFVDSLKRDLDRVFNRMIGEVPSYWFGAGLAKTDRLHLHGAIHSSRSDAPLIRQALLEIGGKWDHQRSKHFQLDLRPMTDPDGWARYVLKQGAAARRIIKVGKSRTIPKELRREGLRLYDDLRAQASGNR